MIERVEALGDLARELEKEARLVSVERRGVEKSRSLQFKVHTYTR